MDAPNLDWIAAELDGLAIALSLASLESVPAELRQLTMPSAEDRARKLLRVLPAMDSTAPEARDEVGIAKGAARATLQMLEAQKTDQYDAHANRLKALADDLRKRHDAIANREQWGALTDYQRQQHRERYGFTPLLEAAVKELEKPGKVPTPDEVYTLARKLDRPIERVAKGLAELFRDFVDAERRPDEDLAEIYEVPVEVVQAARVLVAGGNGQQAEVAENVWSRDGDGYYIRYGGQEGRFRRLVGLDEICRAIQSPGKTTPLVGAVEGNSQQEAQDRDALKDLRRREQELVARLEVSGQTAEEVELRDELEWVESQLSEFAGLAGRVRGLDDEAETARKRISMAVMRAKRKLGDAGLDLLVNHLDAYLTVTVGGIEYRPDSDPDWEV